MQHKPIGYYSPIRMPRLSSVRVNGIDRSSSTAEVSNRKRFSEKKPEPLQLSDVVWRATKAVEEADRAKA